jgi:hypothetical protein
VVSGEFEEECTREWEHLEDRHQVQQQELNVRCEPLRHLTPKFSPELLRMMQSEKTLASLHQYDAGTEVRRLLHVPPYDSAVSRTVWRLYGGANGLVMCHHMIQPLVELYGGCMAVLTVSPQVRRRVEIRKSVELEDFNQLIADRIRLRCARGGHASPLNTAHGAPY